jgi:DNA-binding IclR family transcriptional regulator
LADSPEPLRLSDLARLTGTGRGTVHQQLATLVEGGWVEQCADNRYRPALHSARIGYLALRQASLAQRLRPHLESLAASTLAAASIAVLDGSEALIVQRAEPGRVLLAGLRVGSRLPLASSASGRVLAAYASPEQLIALERLSAALPLEEMQSSIRARGCAVSVGEYLDYVYAVAAPLFDDSGALLAALSIAGPSSRFDGGPAVESVLKSAAAMNLMLSGSGPPAAAPDARQTSRYTRSTPSGSSRAITSPEEFRYAPSLVDNADVSR